MYPNRCNDKRFYVYNRTSNDIIEAIIVLLFHKRLITYILFYFRLEAACVHEGQLHALTEVRKLNKYQEDQIAMANWTLVTRCIEEFLNFIIAVC